MGSILPLSQVATALAAALAVSYLTVLCCGYIATKHKPYPIVVAIGLVAPVRFVSVIPLVSSALATTTLAASSDEAKLARLIDIPPVLFVLAGIVCLVGGWSWLIGTLPRHERTFAGVSLAIGIITGGGLYLNAVGPWLLP